MMNESAADRESQSKFAGWLAQYGEVKETPPGSHYDMSLRTINALYLIEYKRRHIDTTKTPSLFLELAKAVAVETEAKRLEAIPLFVARCDNAAIVYRINCLELLKMPISWVPTRVGESGRSGADTDLLVMVPWSATMSLRFFFAPIPILEAG